MLYVTSEPPGALVSVGGVRRGESPKLVRDLTPGEYKVKLDLAGTASRTESVTIEAGRVTRLEVKLELPKASLTIISQPFEATVFIDRTDRGRTPVTVENLEPGQHEVLIYKENFPRLVREVTLEPGENAILEVELVPKGAAAEEHAEPGPPHEEAKADKLVDILDQFERLIAERDYEEARRWAEEKTQQKYLADIAHDLRAAAGVASALEEREEAVRRRAEQLTDKEVTLHTKSGPREGRVDDITRDGILLSAEIKAGGHVLGRTRFLVKWQDLAHEQEDRLARSWTPSDLHGHAARVFLALARKDFDRAWRGIEACEGHPLASFLKRRLAAIDAERADEAARFAWEEIVRSLRSLSSEIQATRVLTRIAKFEQRHGTAAFAETVRQEIADAKESALKLLRVRELVVEALVDGNSEFHVRPDGVFWRVNGMAKVGRHKGRNEPTWINGKPWMPNWGRPEETRGYDSTDTLLMRIGSVDFRFELLTVGRTRGESGIEPRSPVTTRMENGTMVVSIPDKQGGSRWYSFKLCRE